jgi:hypothetical protein
MFTNIIIAVAVAAIFTIFAILAVGEPGFIAEFACLGLLVGGLVGGLIGLSIPAEVNVETETLKILPLSQTIEIKEPNKYIICDREECGTLRYSFYIKDKDGYPQKVSTDNVKIKESKSKYIYTKKISKIKSIFWGYGHYKTGTEGSLIEVPKEAIYYTFVN